ncbi:MAG: hypothetical protein ABIR37_04135 [Candidatus Saccharimonadales bacterium]
MSRLPVPGDDADIWGDVLNDFLAVSHLDDGRIRVSALPAPQVADGSITPAKLSQAYVPVTDKGSVNGVATLDNAGKVPLAQMPAGSVLTDATTTSKGVVQLAGDLGGTAAAPTVPGLAAKYTMPVGGIPETDLDSNVQTKLNTGGSVGDATSSVKGVVQLAGDLSGSAAAPTVPALSNKVNNSEKGALSGIATLDGSGKVPVSQLPAGLEPDATTTSKGIVQLAGDLAGTATNPTVPGLSAKADDTSVVHKAGNETITGVKVFTSLIEIPGPPIKLTDATNKAYVDSLVPSGGVSDATTSSKGIVQLAGDLAGTAAAPTVPGLATKVNTAAVGANNGIASLDTNGKVPASQLTDATTTNKGIIQLAGDLGGTAASPTVPGIAGKADKTTTVSAGSGLTGGGDLSANRTLAVTYGVSAGTATEGNDSRITGAEQTANKGVANGYASLDGSGHVPATQLLIGSRIQPFSSSGLLMIETGLHRLYNDTGTAWTILSVRASIGVAPTGASVIVDVNTNGTTIFTTQANRPTIAAAANTSGKITNMNVTTVANGDYLTVDIDQVGSTTPGTDLTVQMEVV